MHRKYFILLWTLLPAVWLPWTTATAEATLYGKIHVSMDGINTGFGNHLALSSNSSSVGWKGTHAIADWAAATWRLESNIDTTGERGFFLARSRYAGVATEYGSITAGLHDTPWKSVGRIFDIYSDTLFDTRTLLARDDMNILDIDAKNSILYKSPNLYGFQLSMLRALGAAKRLDNSDASAITSIAMTLKSEYVNLAAAYDAQSQFQNNAARAGLSVKVLIFKVGALAERVHSALYSTMNHDAISGNFTVALPHDISIHTQVTTVANEGQTLFIAAMGSGGISYKPDKDLQFYFIGGRLLNGGTSTYALDNDGHGEKYPLLTAGQDPYAATMGMIIKF